MPKITVNIDYDESAAPIVAQAIKSWEKVMSVDVGTTSIHEHVGLKQVPLEDPNGPPSTATQWDLPPQPPIQNPSTNKGSNDV